ncbi:MAG: GNAT family N-acetyltransferase [Acidimicrobiia bacterium]|nr:GNAT family N-acetyltransferase [Acidimicrobiia bacterium]
MIRLPLTAGPVTLRTWRESDHEALVAEANSHAVWRNLTHMFPHPYTADDAAEWIGRCLEEEPPRNLVVARNDRLIGVCGIDLGEGVSRFTGNVGYWLGEDHWGRGIMTVAFAAFLDYVWETFAVERLQAEVFAWNPASAGVLEKNGFTREGTRRKAIYKDGELIDEWFYSLLRHEVR